MSNTELIIQFSKFVVPCIIIFGALYYFTNKWFEIQSQKIKLDATQKSITQKEESHSDKIFLPLKIDAVQRLVLFLERVSLVNLVMRLHNPALPAGAFQQKLLETVRTEFDHNLAQQVFVSSENWEIVKSSKEEIVKIINMSATQLQPTALSGDLGKAIFEITSQLRVQPTDVAIESLKRELRESL